ncbi:uncharacterized protein CDAR_603721 [Caerostris darwini]|uniref:Uncharacterized protein n=1 Tax=Caerostris darwini TaxID=1538125 RepID=A0AAV4T6U6_9ARAC|nr:uncharacterized protein CDAR_603721 [Caerostris darwini]
MKWIVLALVVVSATCVFAKKCKTSDECDEDECCVVYPIVSFFGGNCKKYRQEGEACPIIDSNADEKPDVHHFLCPCKEGLECVPDRESKITDNITIRRPECVVPGGDDKEETTEVPPVSESD